MGMLWTVPKTADDRKANGGSIEGDTSFDEAAAGGDGTIEVEGADSMDTLNGPGVQLGTPDSRTANGYSWDVTESQFETMRDNCTGSYRSECGGIECTGGKKLLINSENNYMAEGL